MFASTERPPIPEALAARVRPAIPASGRTLQLVAPLDSLLPEGSLRRGGVVVVCGRAGMGATTLGLLLASGVSKAGGWCAAVGLDDPGVVAMCELGLDLRRMVFVPRPRGAWAAATAELLEGMDLVLVRPPARVAHDAARRLHARVRDRACALVVLVEHRSEWPVPAEVVLEASSARWSGTGRLERREVHVEVSGRRVPGRPRHHSLWLPGDDGAVALAG